MPSPFDDESERIRAVEDRPSFPLGVHVGSPGGERRSLEVRWPVPSEYDDGLRFDLVAGLLDHLGCGDSIDPVWAWLTRPGVPEVHDVDLLWLAPARHAFEALGVPLAGFLAVTPAGWLDVVTGESRT